MSPRALVNDAVILPPNCIYCGLRIRASNLARHEFRCGVGLSDRYQIIAVTGIEITEAAMGGSTPRTSYTVIDSYTGVDVFDSWPPHRGNPRMDDEYHRKIAADRCRELNAFAVAS